MKFENLSQYINKYKEIKLIDNNLKKFKVAILSSFTIRGLEETLSVKCYLSGIKSEIYIGAYGQYQQEILDTNSGLYAFKPNIIIVFIDTRKILGDYYLRPYQISEKERENYLNERFMEVELLIQRLKANSTAKILLHNLEVPVYSPLGIVENKQKFGFIESVETFNVKLKNVFREDSQVYIFDYNSFCSKIGKKNVIDYKMYYLGDIKFNWQYMPDLCEEYLAYIKPLMSLARKCLVLDLDNVLWGGILGEDGLEGIKLGPNSEGMPFLELQKVILSLFEKGVILAINSRNNCADVSKVFKEHPYMILGENHFASIKINWEDKATNIKAIAEEINIGLDSLVFMDDDCLNRELVKNMYPEVLVVDMPEDPALYVKTLIELNEFNIMQLTEEDKKRGQIYVEQRKREELRNSADNLDAYLCSLETFVAIEQADSFTIPRISQLTQKTNQFNMTTKRYNEEEITQLCESGKFIVLSVKVSDKFGDSGIVGAVIVKKNKTCWEIDTFLLSCRVIGRRIEESILAYILNMANKEKIEKIIGEFIPNKKNIPAKEFYSKNGFVLTKQEQGKEFWEYNTTRQYTFPQCINMAAI